MSRVTYLLDTNTVSFVISGGSPATRRKWLAAREDRNVRICISVITEAELRYGIARQAPSTNRARAVEALLTSITILEWNSAEAKAYAAARALLKAKAITVDALDLLIAAQAIAADAVLVTHDKIFSRIPGLRTADWATDL